MTGEEARAKVESVKAKIGDDVFALITDDIADFIIDYDAMDSRYAEMQQIVEEQKKYSEDLRDRLIRMYDRVGSMDGESVTGASAETVEPETVDNSLFNMISEDGGIIIG